MSSMYRSGPIWGGIIAALIGLAFCVSMILGFSKALCVTAGCSLLDGVQVAGVSLWWFGGAGFVALGVLCLLPYASLARFAAALALAIDCLLLLIMLFIAPCLPCLVVGLLFAALYVIVRATVFSRERIRRRSILLVVWVVLFFANLFPLGLQYLGVWSLSGPADAPMRVYFSPSCPSCRQALADAEELPAGTLAYLPVAESLDDVRVIARMRAALAGSEPAKSVDAALHQALADTSELSWAELADTGWRVLRNRAVALAAGAKRIPYFTMDGLPGQSSFGTNNAGARPLDIAPNNDSRLISPFGGGFGDTRRPFGPDSFRGCGQDVGAAPCD